MVEGRPQVWEHDRESRRANQTVCRGASPAEFEVVGDIRQRLGGWRCGGPHAVAGCRVQCPGQYAQALSETGPGGRLGQRARPTPLSRGVRRPALKVSGRRPNVQGSLSPGWTIRATLQPLGDLVQLNTGDLVDGKYR